MADCATRSLVSGVQKVSGNIYLWTYRLTRNKLLIFELQLMSCPWHYGIVDKNETYLWKPIAYPFMNPWPHNCLQQSLFVQAHTGCSDYVCRVVLLKPNICMRIVMGADNLHWHIWGGFEYVMVKLKVLKFTWKEYLGNCNNPCDRHMFIQNTRHSNQLIAQTWCC